MKPKIQTLAAMGEAGFLRELVYRLPKTAQGLLVGVGDDCAVLAARRAGSGATVFTTDLLVEGTHFTRESMGSPRLLGRKAVAVNVSDVASMGAAPTTLVVGLGAPPSTPEPFVRELYRGIRDACRLYGCSIAGGDTVRADCLILSIAMLGNLAGGGRGGGDAVLRSGARPGGHVYVTGSPGESAAGLDLLIGTPKASALRAGTLKAKARRLDGATKARLIRRHQDPRARVECGLFLRRALGGRGMAMVDVSDGLVHECALIAEASGAGIEIEAARLPVSPALRRLQQQTGCDALRYVLHGGEDYELLFTADLEPCALTAAAKRHGLGLPIHFIGRVTRRKGVRLIAADGSSHPVSPCGFEHFE